MSEELHKHKHTPGMIDLHTFGDALTAIPLWVAFLFARKLPIKQFTYGYGKVEDLAGLFVVLMIFVSAVVAGCESIYRFFHPQIISHVVIECVPENTSVERGYVHQ